MKRVILMNSSVDPQINLSLFSQKNLNVQLYFLSQSQNYLHHSVPCGAVYQIKVIILNSIFFKSKIHFCWVNLLETLYHVNITEQMMDRSQTVWAGFQRVDDFFDPRFETFLIAALFSS